MDIRPTLALCIPAYNAAEYLPAILASAKNQIIPFDEILIYNDCSKDNTKEVAEKYGAKVIDGDTNRGCSYGKNKLAEVTTCDWVHFHDADDDMYSNFTQLAHKWMNKSNPPDVVLFNYEWRDFDTKQLISIRKFDRELMKKDAIRYSIIDPLPPFCGLYKRSCFLKAGGYDTNPAVLYNEDVAMHISIAEFGLSFSSEEEISIINYRRGNSMSIGNVKKVVEAQFQVMKKTAARVGQKYPEEISDRLWEYCRHAAFHSNWKLVSKIISLIISLKGGIPKKESKVFKTLCLVNPYAAVYLREYGNRIFRKNYRQKVWW